MIELNQLQQFITIVDNNTISNAAKILHISQPALTRSMQRLEQDLNVKLFDHYKNKIILNDNGKLLYKHALDIIGSVDHMVKEVQKLDSIHTTLTIGCVAPAPLWDLEKVLSHYNLNINIEILDEEKLIQGLNNHHFDMILLPKVYDDYYTMHYIDEDLSLSLPIDHKLSSKDVVYFHDLDHETMLLYSNIGFWHDMHLKTMPHTTFLLQNERDAFNYLVRASTLPSFTTNLSIKREGSIDNRVIIPFDEKEAHVSFYLTILKENVSQFKNIINYLEDIK